MGVTIAIVIQMLLFLLLPIGLMKLSRQLNINRFLSDIVLCYGVGMLLGNTKSLWLWSWLSAESAEALATTIATTSQNNGIYFRIAGYSTTANVMRCDGMVAIYG